MNTSTREVLDQRVVFVDDDPDFQISVDIIMRAVYTQIADEVDVRRHMSDDELQSCQQGETGEDEVLSGLKQLFVQKFLNKVIFFPDPIVAQEFFSSPEGNTVALAVLDQRMKGKSVSGRTFLLPGDVVEGTIRKNHPQLRIVNMSADDRSQFLNPHTPFFSKETILKDLPPFIVNVLLGKAV